MSKTDKKLSQEVCSLGKVVKNLSERIRRLELVLGLKAGDTIVCDSGVIDRVGRLEGQIGEVKNKTKGDFSEVKSVVDDLSSQVVAVSLKLQDFEKEWPTVRQAQRMSCKATDGTQSRQPSVRYDAREIKVQERSEGSKLPSSKVSEAAERSSNLVACGRDNKPVGPKVPWGRRIKVSKRKIVVLGDSLARGAGYKIKEQCGSLVEVNAVGGAKLGEIRERISGMSEDPTKALVIVAGANNMEHDDSRLMIDNYLRLVDDAKKVTDDIVIVGLVKRYDLGPRYEAKRIVINNKLRQASEPEQKDFKFVEYEPERRKVHKDGLHLNHLGQVELGGKIHTAFRSFLV
jgi:hypothetical protein